MRAPEGEARYERKCEEGERAAAVASAVTAVTAVILLYACNKCAPLTHASAITFTILTLPSSFLFLCVSQASSASLSLSSALPLLFSTTLFYACHNTAARVSC